MNVVGWKSSASTGDKSGHLAIPLCDPCGSCIPPPRSTLLGTHTCTPLHSVKGSVSLFPLGEARSLWKYHRGCLKGILRVTKDKELHEIRQLCLCLIDVSVTLVAEFPVNPKGSNCGRKPHNACPHRNERGQMWAEPRRGCTVARQMLQPECETLPYPKSIIFEDLEMFSSIYHTV